MNILITYGLWDMLLRIDGIVDRIGIVGTLPWLWKKGVLKGSILEINS